MSGRPQYVDYGALATVPGPLQCDGTTLWCFLLEADRDKLEGLTTKVFTDPTGGAVTVRPLSHIVLATFGVIDAITPTTPPFNQMGTAKEPQVALWVACAIVKRERHVDVAQELFVFVPYIWLDNPISLCSGREVFGWSKSFGTPGLPAPGGPQEWSLDGFGLNYDKHEQPSMRRLLTVTQGAARPGQPPPAHELDHPAALVKWVTAHLGGGGHVLVPGLEFIADLLGDVRAKRLREIYLKQFRAIDDGSSAALQQVVATDMMIGRWSVSPLWHEHALAVTQVDSEPIADELGLADGPIPFAFRVDMDFTVERGTVLWE